MITILTTIEEVSLILLEYSIMSYSSTGVTDEAKNIFKVQATDEKRSVPFICLDREG